MLYIYIYVLMCILPDNGGWRKKRVGGNKEFFFSMHDVSADVGLLEKNKIKLIGWNWLLNDINVTDLWHLNVNI